MPQGAVWSQDVAGLHASAQACVVGIHVVQTMHPEECVAFTKLEDIGHDAHAALATHHQLSLCTRKRCPNHAANIQGPTDLQEWSLPQNPRCGQANCLGVGVGL